MKIEVLVCDLGQVVLPFDFSPAKRFLRTRSTPSNDPLWDPWKAMSGLHDSLGFGMGRCSSRDFFAQVSRSLGLRCNFDEFCTAFSDVFVEDPATIDLVRRARVRLRFLLSNTNSIHWDWITAHHGALLAIFDRLLASHELGLQKPSEAIYKRVEGLTGLPPGAHLLIDDMPENVEGAVAIGWDGIVYTGAIDLEHKLQLRGLLP